MRTAAGTTTRTARRQQTYRWLLVPRRDRWPRRRRDWVPLALAAALVTGLLSVAGWKGPWLLDRTGCRPGLLPAGDVWSADGECVGVSSGSYAFGRAEFTAVLDKVKRQNAAADANPCGTGARAVVVGVLMTLSAPGVGGRAVHELEGIAAGQAQTNRPGCIHPVRLRVGQMGAAEQAAASVARVLAGSDDVVAVVGMGLSDQQGANAAAALAARRIPMVADLITAEGFDKNGSGDDAPDYTTCDPAATYPRGVGEGFFYRIAFRNAVQINQLGDYLRRAASNRLDFVVTPTTTGDPSTCTALPRVHHRFGADVREVRFDPADPTTVSQAAKRICDSDGPVNVFYAARARDLARFLTSIQRESASGLCRSRAITVLSFSDATRLRAPEVEPSLEQLRVEALTSPALRQGTVRLVYTPLADPDVLRRGPGFAALQQTFTDVGFDAADLDDGWAINAYDALTTIGTALTTLSAGRPVTPSQVNTAVGGFSSRGQSVPGAGGSITFDNNGNRSDRAPVVVQLCPAAPGAPAPHPTTVQVYPAAGTCPRGGQ
jgi:ABC-type branched-subunit amino acid transport system substrate-binding protein